jgi:formylglycine-generating enzyme required for sulfatase activity
MDRASGQWSGATACSGATPTCRGGSCVAPSTPAGFVRIDPGSFMMGSPSAEVGRDSDEGQVSVTLTRSFLMSETEVTQGQWKARSGGVNPSCFQTANSTTSCSTANDNDNAPVEQVSWFNPCGKKCLYRHSGPQPPRHGRRCC